MVTVDQRISTFWNTYTLMYTQTYTKGAEHSSNNENIQANEVLANVLRDTIDAAVHDSWTGAMM